MSPANQSRIFLDSLSQPRIHAYDQLFKPQCDTQRMGVYLWGQAVSASLQPFLTVFEVAFRNAIHISLSLQATKFTSASYPWYDVTQPNSLKIVGHSLEKVNEFLFEPIAKGGARRVPAPTPDAVISRLSFGIWPDLLAQQIPKSQRPRTYEDVFRQHPKSNLKYWGNPTHRHEVVMLCKKVQSLRNRVSHAEPVWKPQWLKNVNGRHWSSSVLGLKTYHAELLQLLEWVSCPAAQVYRASFAYSWFLQLCTTNAVFAFMNDPLNTAHLAPIAKPIPPDSKINLLY